MITTQNQIIETMKDLNILIIFINVNNILIKEGDQILKQFLKSVLSSCNKIQFLMTSGEEIGVVGEFRETVWNVWELTYE